MSDVPIIIDVIVQNLMPIISQQEAKNEAAYF